MPRHRIGLVALLVLPHAAMARDVLLVGPDETYTTIGSALAAASDGDRLIIRGGTYEECLEISTDLEMMAYPQDRVALQCTADVSSAQYAISTTKPLALEAFDIRHTGGGGGIYTEGGGALVVQWSTFEGLSASSTSAGIHSEGSDVYIQYSSFTGCEAFGGEGGAVWVKNADLTLVDVTAQDVS
ncbi:MAG: hypothetical protein JRJ84_21530, partial [Deltaproteobacteria bacterium]|nr:hypothetical protein [Deltaproteobacteria bacterium]